MRMLKPQWQSHIRGVVLGSSKAASSTLSVQKLRDDKISTAQPTPVNPSQVAFHWETQRATKSQRLRAEKLFTKHPPTVLCTAGSLHQIPFTSVPEVAFFGRSNVGKSSLLNAIMAAKLCYASSKPGRTRTINAYSIGGQDGAGHAGRLTILDMPGYGKGSRQEWGTLIEKYLAKRRELKRVFLMIDPVHGLKDTDEAFLQTLRHNAIPHQVILSKVDKILLPQKVSATRLAETFQHNLGSLGDLVESLKQRIQPMNDGPPALGEVLACSTDMGHWKHLTTEKMGQIGINAVRWAIMVAAGINNTKSAAYKVIQNEVVKPGFEVEQSETETEESKEERIF